MLVMLNQFLRVLSRDGSQMLPFAQDSRAVALVLVCLGLRLVFLDLFWVGLWIVVWRRLFVILWRERKFGMERLKLVLTSLRETSLELCIGSGVSLMELKTSSAKDFFSQSVKACHSLICQDDPFRIYFFVL